MPAAAALPARSFSHGALNKTILPPRRPLGAPASLLLPEIHSEGDAAEFADKTVSHAQRFKEQATKRRVFAQLSEYIRGRGKGSVKELYSKVSTHGGVGIASPTHGDTKRGITREDFKDFLKHTSLGPGITDGEMDLAFDMADRNSSGSIDYQEFLEVFAPEQLREVHEIHHELDQTNAERLAVRGYLWRWWRWYVLVVVVPGGRWRRWL